MKMKILTICFFTTMCVNVYGQTTSYPFEIQKTGQGKSSIIFIPGFASSGEVWNETKSEFEKDHTCYSLTMAGFAGMKPEENSTFENWKVAIAHFIKNTKIEKPIIVGHSLGGALALAIASDYPNLISKIIVVDALPYLAALMNPNFESNENNDCSKTVYQMTSMTDEQFYQMQKMSVPSLLADTTMQKKVVNWSVTSDRKTFAEMYCDFSNTDLRERIKSIKCPSLILLNSNFSSIKSNIEKQYENLRTANLKYATKGLHFIMYDDKEWYFEQLNHFLN
ncbi:alpha/beta hydrolase [Leptobacterium sp. I13]|uniref:alpha/beta fold hydrolase n=1 Tax=Leptobacterium meishanense TaxID=3128904 RepID=UPI0030EED8A6